MAVISGTSAPSGKPKRKKVSPERAEYRKKTPPYNRSPREFVKKEASPKKAAAVGKSLESGNTRAYKRAVKKPTTQKEAQGSVRNFKRGVAERKAKRVVRAATRRAVRKGISGPTEDSLGITKNEGSKRLRKAVKTLGYDKSVGVASKTRMRRGQTYKGGKGWR